MPKKGGTSDKLGNSFEAYWMVHCFAQILSGETDIIRLEPAGAKGEGHL